MCKVFKWRYGLAKTLCCVRGYTFRHLSHMQIYCHDFRFSFEMIQGGFLNAANGICHSDVTFCAELKALILSLANYY